MRFMFCYCWRFVYFFLWLVVHASSVTWDADVQIFYVPRVVCEKSLYASFNRADEVFLFDASGRRENL